MLWLLCLILQAEKDIYLSSNWAITIPVIDGYIDTLSEWKEATKIDISVKSPTYFAKKTYPPGSALLFLKNDSNFLYLAVSAPIDKELEKGDGIAMFFDDNGDKSYPSSPPFNEGEIVLVYTKKGRQVFWGSISDSLIKEWSAVIKKAHSTSCLGLMLMFISSSFGKMNIPEIEMDSITGLQASISVGDGHLNYEIAIPLDEKDWAINASCGDTIGFSISPRDSKKGIYGWWPSGAMDIHNPEEMGFLILSRLQSSK